MEMTITQALSQRILLLDGAMGTLLQSRLPYYQGLADALVLQQPQEIAQIHRAYLAAGADCITTCTFNSHGKREINIRAAQIARRVADEYTATTGQQRYVLGDLGPTAMMLSMSPDLNRPDHRDCTFDTLAENYRIQIAALFEGGADAILIETATDTLNVKAALWAAEQVAEETGRPCPVMISMTVVDKSGRTLSGQTIEAFVESVIYAHPLSIGLNCGFGAEAILPWLRQMHRAVAGRCHVSCHPNAGLPNAVGQYDQTPDDMARIIRTMVAEGLVRMVGGCCGTTPDFIRSFRNVLNEEKPSSATVASQPCRISAIC